MSGGGAEFEYPDEAGYPDGMGTLHEGTDEQDAGAPGGDQGAASGAAAGEAANEIDDFAMQDEEDVDKGV